MNRRILRIVGIGAVLTALLLTLLVPIVASAEDEVTQQNILDEYQNDGLTESQATYQTVVSLTEILPSTAFQGNIPLPEWLDTFLRHANRGSSYDVGYSFIKFDMSFYDQNEEYITVPLGIASLGNFFDSSEPSIITLTSYNSYYDSNIGIVFEKALDWTTFEFEEYIRVSGGDLIDPSTTDFTFTIYANPLVKFGDDYEVLIGNYELLQDELARSMQVNDELRHTIAELRDTIASKNIVDDVFDAFYDSIANFLDAFEEVEVLGITLKDILFILLAVVFIIVIVKIILVVL